MKNKMYNTKDKKVFMYNIGIVKSLLQHQLYNLERVDHHIVAKP